MALQLKHMHMLSGAVCCRRRPAAEFLRGCKLLASFKPEVVEISLRADK